MWIRTTNQLAWNIHPSLPFIHFSSSLSTQRHTHIHIYVGVVAVVQSLSRVWLFATPWTVASQAFLSITNSQSLLKLISTELEMPSNHPILYCPHLLLSSVFPSIRSFPVSQLFMSGGQSIGASVSASVLPMNIQDWLVWYPCHPILWHSAFFMVQFSHPYMTTGKTIALTRWTLVGKVMSLLLNMLYRLVITFLPRSKRLLISWLQSPSAVILEPQK